MSSFVSSKEYAHFPIRSLCYYARRKSLLYCTYRRAPDNLGHYETPRDSVSRLRLRARR